MVNKIIFVFIVVIVVILVGTFPLSILEIVFRAIATAFGWLAKILNLFGWNGLLT